jgi:hypothetical protein
MSTKCKESAKTAKSAETMVASRGDSKCLVQEQDPYRDRRVGGTIRKTNGSIWRYSKYDEPPGKTTVSRYPLTAPQSESEERGGGTCSEICRVTEILTEKAGPDDHRQTDGSKRHTESEKSRKSSQNTARLASESKSKSRKTGWW